MSDQDELLRVVHGARVLVPPDWEDSSLYRFNAPPEEADVPEAERGGALRLQPNVLISRHEKRHGDTPERFFEQTNADARGQNPSFEVVRSGTVMYLGQVATWQDTRFTDPKSSAAICQRQLLIPSWPRHLTLVTLTGTAAAIERMSGQMKLAHLADPASGTRVQTGEGVVAGVLRSKLDEEK
jgi:hypothetical protein